jgi:hypothetical protein
VFLLTLVIAIRECDRVFTADQRTATFDVGQKERTVAGDQGEVPRGVPPKDSTPDPETGILNAKAICRVSPRLADAVEGVLDAGEFPVVLDGDCTIVLRSTLAFRGRGRYGLFFIDGNADFFQPEAEPNGEGPHRLRFDSGGDHNTQPLYVSGVLIHILRTPIRGAICLMRSLLSIRLSGLTC